MRTPGNRRTAGFGSFELLWALFLVGVATALVHVGSRLVGSPLGAWASFALGVGALAVGLAAFGIVVGVLERRDEAVPTPAAQDDPFDNRIAPAPVTTSQPEEGGRCCRVLEDTEGKRRVRILQRDTGGYTLEEEHFSTRPFEQGWIPQARAHVGIYDSEETAVREARANIDWLQSEPAAGQAEDA